MNTKIFNLKYIILSTIMVGLFSCEGRREFPDLVETGVTLDNTDILLISGETEDINPRFVPNIFPSRDYLWEIEDPSIADLVMNEDKSVTITAKEAGETVLRIVSQDAANLSAEAQLKVIASAPVDITDQAQISVNRENGGGPTANEGSLKLVDGDLNTKYLSGYTKPFWVTLEFEEAKVVNFYQLTSGNDAPDRDPRDWEIQGSNDGENWEVLDVRVDQVFNGRNLTREFYFENDTAYTHYRFDVVNNNGGGLFQMSEWRLLSIPE
jgi:hypothetical protein